MLTALWEELNDVRKGVRLSVEVRIKYRSRGWGSDSPLGQWLGVTTDSNGRVTELVMEDVQLNMIPWELGNLANLTSLSLSGDRFLVGEIPPELGNLTNLKVLNLINTSRYSGGLSGEIPPELGNLANLTSLDLGGNGFSEIPPELGNLANLTSLDLSRNYLSGEIPPELGNLANLELLYLDNNQLGGEIPPELGNLANLKTLGLARNQLSGEIPPELGNLANLKTLGLARNQLSGEIPPELGNLANLTSLSLFENGLSGEIPPELGNLANLTSLSLVDNELSGEIPPELGSLANLELLDLEGNGLSGEIPSELGNLANLKTLDLKGNGLSGEIPSELGNLANLKTLDLGHLGTWCVPRQLRQQWKGVRIPIPRSNSSATVEDIGICPDPKAMTALAALYNATDGDNWYDNTNWLSDSPFDLWFGVTTDDEGRITELRLHENDLSGELPPELGNFASLKVLYLIGNNLTGCVPASLRDQLEDAELGNLDYCP